MSSFRIDLSELFQIMKFVIVKLVTDFSLYNTLTLEIAFVLFLMMGKETDLKEIRFLDNPFLPQKAPKRVQIARRI